MCGAKYPPAPASRGMLNGGAIDSAHMALGLHQRAGIARPGPVVAFGVRAERLRYLPRLMSLTRLGSGNRCWLRRYSGHAPTISGRMPTHQPGRARREKERSAVPTGVAIRDPRAQLFEAAGRVLLRDGPDALTSRAVTTEAGVAKGVLHRHFADFDAFLAEFVLDRIARLDTQAAALRNSAGKASK